MVILLASYWVCSKRWPLRGLNAARSSCRYWSYIAGPVMSMCSRRTVTGAFVDMDEHANVLIPRGASTLITGL